MVRSRNVGIFLLSALFSASASARTGGYWMKPPKEPETRAREGYRESQDFPIENDGELSNRENYFQEIYVLQSAPKHIEFGHVCENPDEWEQRYERKDFDQNRHQGKTFPHRSYHHLPEYDSYEFGYKRGNDFHVKERFEKGAPTHGHFRIKVRWADKKGGHGEHYWDYNHSGRSGNSQEKEEEEEDEGSESSTRFSETESTTRQHRKQRLVPETEGTDSESSSSSESRRREAQDFLTSFRREIGGIFDLESQNRNIFSGRTPPPRQFDINFPFTLEATEKTAWHRTPITQ